MPLIKGSAFLPVVPIIINNQPQAIDETLLEPVVNANSGKTIHYFQSASSESCSQACDAAWAAFRTWKRATVTKRRQVLGRVMELIKERRLEIADAVKTETCCADSMAIYNADMSIPHIQELSCAISEIRGTIPANDTGGTTSVFKEPIGPILVIPPWNAPFMLGMKAVCGVIAAGCTVVLKASELSPLSQHLMVDILIEAGCPPGVINSLSVRRSDAGALTEELILNTHIRKIEFIGSANIGRIIASTAARNLKSCVLELGGKAPFIVCEDADLDRAASMATQGALMHHGQICISTERIIVLRSIAKEFISKLTSRFQTAKSGDACHVNFAQHAYDVVKEAKDKGAKVLAGDAEFEKPNSLRPMLLQLDPKTASSADTRIVDEETFGPSATVYVVGSDEEAIELANRTVYGLNSAVHTRDMARGMRIAREIEFGQVNINAPTSVNNWYGPFMGVKSSGWGKGRGKWLLDEWHIEKTVTWED